MGAILGGELLGESEIDDVDPAWIPSGAHEKVIGLNIAVDEHAAVDVLQPLQHLVRHQQDCLEIELSVALGENILERWPEQLHHHEIVLALRCAQEIMRQAVVCCVLVVQVVQDFGFVEQLRGF